MLGVTVDEKIYNEWSETSSKAYILNMGYKCFGVVEGSTAYGRVLPTFKY